MKFAPMIAKLATVGFAVTATAGVAGVGVASAAPIDKTFNFSCDYPSYGSGPMTVRVKTTLPDSAKVDEPTAETPVDVSATIPEEVADSIRLIGAAEFSGKADAKINGKDGAGTALSQNISLNVPLYQDTGSGPVTIAATGTVAPITIHNAGTGTIELDPAFSASIKFRDANGYPTALGDTTEVTCTADDPSALGIGSVPVS